MLLSCLKSGAEEVVWVAQSGEKQSQTVKLVEGSGVVIDTTVFVGSSPSSATVSTETAKVTMMDLDRDGVMDRIQYVMPDGSKQGYNRDFDEGSQFLWDSALAITFQYSNCFRN